VKHIMPEDEATYRPRQFGFERYALDMWGSLPTHSGFAEKKPEKEKMRVVV
jgi:hypothetical protein